MAITLHSSGSVDEGIEVPLSTVSTGDFIICQWTFDNAGGTRVFTSVTDNVNSGNYTTIFNHNNATFGNQTGISYFQNSAEFVSQITLNYSGTPSGFPGMSCQAFSGIATTGNVIDNIQQQDGASTSNPTSGGNLTPVGNGELVIAGLIVFSGDTPTPGANYSLLQGAQPNSGQYSEYWIQTTATATNGPFTLASDTWTDQMVFISPTSLTPPTFTPDEDFWTAPSPVPTDSIISIF